MTAEEGIKINRQGNSEAIIEIIRENNKPEWATYKTNNKKMNKMKKKLIEENKGGEDTKENNQPTATIFQQQVQ